VPFSTDSDYSTFSDSEQTAIKGIWQRVSEDYALFDVNVTTARPSSFTTRTAMALITRSTDENGASNPGGGGGVAYIDVFATSSYATYRPAWIYFNNLANNDSYIAEAVSHEIGHNMGLSHDGTSSTGYYRGHGSGEISWAPIMGTAYNQNVSQWSKGEYYQANNTQDDLAVIAGKLTYATDDHGGTRTSATPLVISGGAGIVSTTPEDDPTNSDKSNKGVLERGTDVDIFSFVSGSGPVNLAVNPWITPSGTRGGNVDLLVELYDEGGRLLLASNDADKTGAVINTTLAQGRYYLYVKNSAAGNPLVSPPTGYTAYASLGQYFITGTITPGTGFVDPPLAALQATNLTQPGQAMIQFSVTYSNSVPINVSTIDSNDIRITGPDGYDQLAALVSLDVASNGTPRTAAYAVTAPGGGNWSPAHNGTYQISMQAGQVKDTASTAVAAGPLGVFDVSVPVSFYAANMDTDPGWTLQPAWQYGAPGYSGSGPVSGFTGTRILGYNLSGNYTSGLTSKFATTPIINTTGSNSLTLRFKRWLRTRNGDPVSIEVSTDGVSWLSVWSTSSAVADSSWQSVQYTLPAGAVGSPTLRLRWGLSSNSSQNDIGWNIDDVELTGTGTASFDSNPPQASLNVAGLTATEQSGHPCSVTYTDANAVRRTSLDSTDLLVTGPNGYSQLAAFVGADLSIDGSPLTGSYAIPAPDNVAWNAADNGVYAVTLRPGEVEDTFGNVNPATPLGTFTVAISAASPGTMAVASSGDLHSSGTVGGPFTPGSAAYTLSNPGGTAINWSAGKPTSWLDLSATGGSLAPGESITVTVSLNAGANALAAATYNDTVIFTNMTNGSGDASRSVSLTVNSPGRLLVETAGDLLASGMVGGPFTPGSAVYTLSNPGGTAITWSAGKATSWLDLSATGGSLAPGASTTVTVSLNAGAGALVPSTYNDTVSFEFTIIGSGTTGGGQSAAAGTPVTRAVILTVLENIKVIGQQLSGTGVFEIVIQGTPNMQITLEGTTDFIKWTGITSGQIGSDGTLMLRDTESVALPTRFYRAYVSSP
jgi:Metallo-peptidase family M12/Viral BACON domain